MARPTGPHALQAMLMGYYREPLGDGKLSAFSVVQPLPAAFESEKRLDYTGRSDDRPVYVGFAESTEASGTPLTTDRWIVQKFTYDGSDRITRIQVARGAWDDRVSLFV